MKSDTKEYIKIYLYKILKQAKLIYSGEKIKILLLDSGNKNLLEGA